MREETTPPKKVQHENLSRAGSSQRWPHILEGSYDGRREDSVSVIGAEGQGARAPQETRQSPGNKPEICDARRNLRACENEPPSQ